MKYTWEDLEKFFEVYKSDNGKTRTAFVKKMKDYKVSEEESTLIWQAFDMALEQVFHYGSHVIMRTIADSQQ